MLPNSHVSFDFFFFHLGALEVLLTDPELNHELLE